MKMLPLMMIDPDDVEMGRALGLAVVTLGGAKRGGMGPAIVRLLMNLIGTAHLYDAPCAARMIDAAMRARMQSRESAPVNEAERACLALSESIQRQTDAFMGQSKH